MKGDINLKTIYRPSLNETEKERLLVIQKALTDFIVRVSSGVYAQSQEEIAILPEIVKVLVSTF